MLAALFRRTLYRPLMKLAHRYNWHYAPPCYPDGDTMLWCHWCGMKYVKPKLRGFDGRRPKMQAMKPNTNWMT